MSNRFEWLSNDGVPEIYLVNKQEAEFLESCLFVYRKHAGSATPVEQLLVDLVQLYGRISMFTPDEAEEEFRRFRVNHEAFIEAADTLLNNRPELVSKSVDFAAGYLSKQRRETAKEVSHA